MDDEEGYPSAEVLHEIEMFSIGDKCERLKEFLTLIWENWRYSDGFIYIPETGVLELHTYGWSGNEDLIEAIKQQKMFWAYFWQSSARGGHYRFERLRVPGLQPKVPGELRSLSKRTRGVTGMDRLAYALLRENLAELEHAQWAHWTEYMLDNMTPENVARWKDQCQRPYSALTEQEKNSDRKWADKVLEIIATNILVER